MMKRALTTAAVGGAFVLLVVVAGLFVSTLLTQHTPQPSDDTNVGETSTTTTPVDTTTVEGPFGHDEYWVTNPTSGTKWHVQVLAPLMQSTGIALVLVPGGTEEAKSFVSGSHRALDLTEEGITVVIFDPEGRGKTEGAEDNDGFVDQDGLNEVVNFAATLDDVQTVGITSFSYGVTMASGMLARYPASPAAFLIDWEGPANRTDTGGCDASNTGHLKDAGCNDEAFWKEREAVTFIRDVRVPYQRIQSEKDHAQTDYMHTVKMVNAAFSGGMPWVRLNSTVVTRPVAQSTVDPVTEVLERQLMTTVAESAVYITTQVLAQE